MNTLENDEKLELQRKLGKKIRQYKNLIEMANDSAAELNALDRDPETVSLREAYNKRKKEIGELSEQTKMLSLQAKKIKKEIDEIQDALCLKRKRRRKDESEEK